MSHEKSVRVQIRQHARQVEDLQRLLEDNAGSLERIDGWQQEIAWHGERMLALRQSLQQSKEREREARNRVAQRHSLR